MLGQVLNTVLRFLMLPYLARSLSVVDYGTYGQVILVGEILLLIFSMGFSQVLFVQFANKSYSQGNVFSTSILVNITIGLLGVLVVLFSEISISKLMNNEALVGLLAIYCWQILLQLINTTLNSTLIYFDKVKRFVSINVLTNLLRLVSLFIAIQYLGSLRWIFLLLLISAFSHAVWGMLSVPRKLFKGRFDLMLAKNQFALGIPLGITGVLSTLFKKVDGLMISNMLGTEEFAIYRMGAIEIPLLATLFYSVSTIVMPEVSKLIAERNYGQVLNLKRKATSNSMVLIYPSLVFILIFSHPLLLAYLGNAYSASIPIFIIYNLILFIRINDYRDILIASSKTKIILQAVFISLILNIGLNYLFISWKGNIGAVMASIISFVALALTLQIRTNTLISSKFSDLFEFKKIMYVFTISLVTGALCYLAWTQILSMWIIPALFISFILIVYTLIHRVGFLDVKTISSPLDRIPALKSFVHAYLQRIRPF